MTRIFGWMLGFCLVGCTTAVPPTAPDAAADVAADAAVADVAAPTDLAAADTAAADTAATDAADATPADAGPVWVAGDRKLSGAAFFFSATGVGAIDQQKDVTGATAYLLEFPQISQPVAADGSFTFSGLPEGGEFTVAIVHPDYYPSLSPIIAIGKTDVSNVNFQVVTQLIAMYLGLLVGYDPSDPTQCQMVVTVTAQGANQDLWWAPGEPGATVTTAPVLPPEHGPFYFNTSVMPDKTLTQTTTDGGVLIAGAKPGVYTWTAHKDGVTFTTQRLKCVGGWLTNGVPPLGLQAGKNGG